MKKSFIFPSVLEENYREFEKVSDNFLEAMKIVGFKDRDYIVGELALKEGHSPHKLLNSSAEEIDYQLLGIIGLLVASQGSFSKLVVTTGFSFTSYQPYKQGSVAFLKGPHEIAFDTRTLGGLGLENNKFDVPEADVISEVDGAVKFLRNGEVNEKDHFFIASLGYGTFEMALSAPSGLIHRTTHSSHGLLYAINRLETELQKEFYLSMLNEQQLERAFQRGEMIISRKKKDLKALREKVLRSYYNEVISPAMRKKFTDEDFFRSQKIYLVGGGAMYDELVNLFKAEFEGVLEVIVAPEPNLAASRGYCQHSVELAKKTVNALGDKSSIACVGLDLGNNNTVVTVTNDL